MSESGNLSKKSFPIEIVCSISMLVKKGAYKRVHTTRSYTSRYFDSDLFYTRIRHTTYASPHPFLIQAAHDIDPGFTVLEIVLIIIAIFDLLIRYVFSSVKGYSKFLITLTLIDKDGKDITYTICDAIPLTPLDGSAFLPYKDIFSYIYRAVIQVFETYKGAIISKIALRIFLTGQNLEKHLSKDEIIKILDTLLEDLSHDDDGYNSDWDGSENGNHVGNKNESKKSLGLLSLVLNDKRDVKPPVAKPISNKKRTYNSNISQIISSNPNPKGVTPFMVADIETILHKDDTGMEVQTPYAVGLLVVLPEKEVDKADIMTFYSEDLLYKAIYSSFKDRSEKILYEMVKRIDVVATTQYKTAKSIYFHNLSRFDGIILLKHLICHHPYYSIQPLIRNHRIYEIKVYKKMQQEVNEKMVDKKGVLLFSFKDSLNLLPGKLATLAQSLCPDLGAKYDFDHEQLKTVEDISLREEELREYLKQDVLLLGGVLKKAQEIILNIYNVNINTVLTISSLAMRIFRIQYYDASSFPIHIPNVNEDQFIRKGYYGGHVDVYKPRGENLYYYDVNSLYPYVMQEYPMPAGKPYWNGDLRKKDLDTLYGFIEAYVKCPDSIKKPFLPYREKVNGSLIFPTGYFVGVYYSEELKYARDLGYTIYPLRGYLFKKTESPFKTFVNDLYNSRLEAKKDGNEGMSYVYKILMNSLYGRFGINPKMTITEICNQDCYNQLVRKDTFINGDKLYEDTYVANLKKDLSTDSWDPPKNAAVQLAAAITACARIHMYPYIAREDCYYTDTDSIVLGNPLSDDMVSSSVLGKLKLEDQIAWGLFLAPKTYCYTTIDGKDVLKHKGAAKHFVDIDWYENQYANRKNEKSVPYSTPFGVDWNQLRIVKKTSHLAMNVDIGTKRNVVYSENNVWLETTPFKVENLKDCSNQDLRYIIKKIQHEKDKEDETTNTSSTTPTDGKKETESSNVDDSTSSPTSSSTTIDDRTSTNAPYSTVENPRSGNDSDEDGYASDRNERSDSRSGNDSNNHNSNERSGGNNVDERSDSRSGYGSSHESNDNSNSSGSDEDGDNKDEILPDKEDETTNTSEKSSSTTPTDGNKETEARTVRSDGNGSYYDSTSYSTVDTQHTDDHDSEPENSSPGNDSNNNNDNSSGNGKGWSLEKEYDNNSGSDNKSCTPPENHSSSDSDNNNNRTSSPTTTNSSSGWDKVNEQLRREREQREREQREREATSSTSSTCEPTSTYAPTANDYTTARNVDDYSQRDTIGENELIEHYVIRMENKDRVKEIWDRKARAEEMLSKLNSDNVYNPRTRNYWKDEIRCVNRAYAIFKTQKDIREGKTTVEDITLSNWYAGDYSADIPYPYDPDVKILLDKFKDKEKAQHVWLWKERTHMELKREAEKGDNADQRLLMLYKYRIACVKVAYSKYMDSQQMDGDERLESLADFLPSNDSYDYESNGSYYDSYDVESNGKNDDSSLTTSVNDTTTSEDRVTNDYTTSSSNDSYYDSSSSIDISAQELDRSSDKTDDHTQEQRDNAHLSEPFKRDKEVEHLEKNQDDP